MAEGLIDPVADSVIYAISADDVAGGISCQAIDGFSHKCRAFLGLSSLPNSPAPNGRADDL